MLNKTPKARAAKTASVPNTTKLILLAVVTLGLLMRMSWYHPTVLVNNKRFEIEVAKTAEAQKQGLSGRESLPINNAMLFSFAKDTEVCFWMKDMRFPIDIVWLDADKRVVFLELSLSPKTYPNSYCPGMPVAHTLEFNAGVIKSRGITIGSRLIF